MNRILSFAAAALITFVALTLPTAAQSSRLKPFIPGGKSEKMVTVSVSYQFFLEGDTKSVEDQAALADQGRRHLYKLLAKECEVLLETIASDCRINRANVNTQLRRQNRSSIRREGVRVSGTATYQISLQPNAKKND